MKWIERKGTSRPAGSFTYYGKVSERPVFGWKIGIPKYDGEREGASVVVHSKRSCKWGAGNGRSLLRNMGQVPEPGTTEKWSQIGAEVSPWDLRVKHSHPILEGFSHDKVSSYQKRVCLAAGKRANTQVLGSLLAPRHFVHCLISFIARKRPTLTVANAASPVGHCLLENILRCSRYSPKRISTDRSKPVCGSLQSWRIQSCSRLYLDLAYLGKSPPPLPKYETGHKWGISLVPGKYSSFLEFTLRRRAFCRVHSVLHLALSWMI